MDRYDRFEAISELMSPAIVRDDDRMLEMHKMCITGELGIGDYGRGVVNVEVRVATHPFYNGPKPACRLSVATIDDGGMGGWPLSLESMEEARELAHKIMDVFREYTVLPTREKINEKLFPLGICLDYE